MFFQENFLENLLEILEFKKKKRLDFSWKFLGDEKIFNKKSLDFSWKLFYFKEKNKKNEVEKF